MVVGGESEKKRLARAASYDEADGDKFECHTNATPMPHQCHHLLL